MSLFPRNTETLCHRCAAHMVTADTTDALQDFVAGWLAESFAPPLFDDEPARQQLVYREEATRLLAMIARTARAIPQIETDPPF